MNSKRLISMFLSLLMVASCLVVTPISVAASEGTGFVNLVADPGFDGALDTDVWSMAGYATGSVDIVDDTKNAENKVLRVDCSNNTKSISFVQYQSLDAGTYYMNCKIRLADVDQPEHDSYYVYENRLSSFITKSPNAVAPAVTKDGWSECYGVFTLTATSNVGFKITFGRSNSDNISKAIYEIDDFTIYDLANAKNITAPEGVTFTSDNVVKSHDNKYYAVQGSEVSLTYAKDGYTLSAEGAEMTQDANTYTFTVGSSNVNISEVEAAPATEFENLVADPGFDGTYADGYDSTVWSMNTYATGDIEIVTDTKDATNKVLRVDFTDNTKNISYVEYQNVPEGTYYMHCKVRLADVDQPAADSYYVYENRLSGSITKYPNAVAPAVTKGEWAECYGVFTKTATQNIGFKITSKRENNANIKEAIYEIDDFTIYNLANAKNITAPEGVTFTSDNVVKSHDNTYYAVNGSEVTFTYAKDGYTLSAEGAEMTQNGSAYTFTVDSSDITIIEEAAPATEFENLVADPGFDGALDTNVWAMSTSANAKGTVSIMTDSKDSTNKVLRVDCSSNGTEATNISYVNYKSLDKGTYYLHCKVRLADVDQPEHDNYYMYANSLGGIDNIYWDATRPAITKDGWSECYGKFTVAADGSSVGFKIIYTQGASGNNVGRAVYEIDDFTIYNLVNAKNIAVPSGVSFTSDNVVKSHDNTYYAINGNDVAFTYDGAGLEALYINGEEATATDGAYSHTVESDVLVLAIANQANEDKVKYAYTAAKPYAIFEEDATFTVIVAGHNDAGVFTEVYISEITGTKGQIINLDTVEDFKAISGWANKTIFTWENLETLNPIRSKCVLKDL